MHSWKSEVLETFGPEGQSVLVSRPRAVKVERRRFQRYTIEIPLSFRVIYSGERRVVAREVFNATTTIISAGAVEFETEVTLEDGEILELQIYLSESQQVSTTGQVSPTGKVIRVNKKTSINSVVVRFLALNPEDHDRLETFLKKSQK